MKFELKLRQMAVAFIINPRNEVLLLQKSSSHTFLPGKLVPIGGHMEQGELNDPKRAIIREVQEETGLILEYLQLKYIVHRLKAVDNEISIQYIFFANVQENLELVASDEGELYWINMKDIKNENVSETTMAIATHFINHPEHEMIFTGTMRSNHGEATISWSILEDWL